MQGKQLTKASLRCAAALFCAIGLMLSSCDRRESVLSGLVDSSAIVHSDVIRHGVDTIRVYEINGDQDAVDRIVAAWSLKKATNDDRMSFLTNGAPSWWHHSHDKSGWQRYSQSDENAERYWSVWYSPEMGRIFIEVGQW